jgi:tetratricopeptide (TPR) repeat protein
VSKFFLFVLLAYLFRNPILALIVVLLIVYFIDRQWVGLLPNVGRPLRRASRIRKLKEELKLNPHHTSARHELAALLMQAKRHAEAAALLEQVRERMESDDVQAELAVCYVHLGRREEAVRLLEDVLARNPRVKYGEPLLVFGAQFARTDPERALAYLRKFQEVQSSSVEGYYRLGQIYRALGRKDEASAAFREAQEIYRGLPKYKRKSERRWYLLSLMNR